MSKEKKFQQEFKNPSAQFRGAPFWAWNGELNKDLLREQIDIFNKMGFGGYHIHSRIGLSTEYMGEEFLDCVKECLEYGREKGMLTYLYDEDKWPSGYGAGRVTREDEFGARYLLFTPFLHPEGMYDRNLPPSFRLSSNGNLKYLASYRVDLQEGKLVGYERTRSWKEGQWNAYLVLTESLPWFNNQPYADTLNPEAVKKFAEVNYEPYREAVGQSFLEDIPSIFTDEPQFKRFENMKDGGVPQEVGIPFTDRLQDACRERFGEELLDRLPEIFWEHADGTPSTFRYRYFNLIADQFAGSYVKTLADWCHTNGIVLTGHLMEEGGLEKQARSIGDAMRSYYYFQRPGIDMLADNYEYTTVKQAQSVSRQMGRKGLTSELYGVTNWDFDFRGHKLQGDWQAASGVTLRVPHLAWMYMGGESKRDYPAPIDGHSPWHDKYCLIEDYFGRVNVVLEKGKPCVDIAVLHPIESMFLIMGPDSDTLQKRRLLETQFHTLARWLLFGQLDYDYLDEKLLTKLLVKAEKGILQAGEMKYRVVIIPPLLTIRGTTLEILRQFAASGGKVVNMGADAYIDAVTCKSGIWEKFERIGFDQYRLYEVLEPFRKVRITDPAGTARTDLLYQLRRDQDAGYLFIAHGTRIKEETFGVFEERQPEIRIELPGNFDVEVLDAMTGEIYPADYKVCRKKTEISALFEEQSSLLFRLKPARDGTRRPISVSDRKERGFLTVCLPKTAEYTLEEPNVMVLDMAEYRLDDGIWQPEEEILKIDDRVREWCGYRKRTDCFPQPWLTGSDNPCGHVVGLRFHIRSHADLSDLELAAETEENWRIRCNGREILENTFPSVCRGKYVDSKIRRYHLGSLEKGDNLLECNIPFGPLTNLENLFLLGSFGVLILGAEKELQEIPAKVGYQSYTYQGFPFYGGNFIYETNVELPAGEVVVETGDYDAPLLELQLDDKEPEPLFLAPYRVSLGRAEAGRHKIRIRAFGNRINTFGQLHNCNEKERYFGPKTWRTQGKDWCYEYRLHSCGLRKAPLIKVYPVE